MAVQAGADIDPDCQLLKLGVDEETIARKKKKERELMRDNIGMSYKARSHMTCQINFML